MGQGLAVSPAGNVYVSGPHRNPNTIVEYSSDGNVRLHTLTGATSPWLMTFDSNSNLYVTSLNGSAIYVFPPGQTKPSYAITNGISDPGQSVIDGSNNLYVMNGLSSPYIDVFAPGATEPTYQINPNPASPGAMVVTPAGELYVLSCGSSPPPEIQVYAPGTTSPAYTITNGLAEYGNAITLGEHGNLYVATHTTSEVSGYVAVYSPGATAPAYTITLPSAGFVPAQMTCDSSGNLYVQMLPNIYVYAAGTANLLGTLTLKSPVATAIGK